MLVLLLGAGAYYFPVQRPFSDINPFCSFYIVIMALMGISVVISISVWLKKIYFLQRALSYVGEHTLVILGLHLIIFKLVSVCYVILYGYPTKMISEYPVILDFAHEGGWIIYSFFGIFMPLLTVKAKIYAKSVILKK